jgi:hypothetical protein
VIFLSGFEPASNGILDIQDCLGLGFAVRHAAGQIGNSRDKTATILLGKRFDNDVVMRTLAHESFSVLQEGYKLPDIYRFNRTPGRDGQYFALADLGYLVMGTAAPRRRASRTRICANLYNIANSPAAGRVLAHLLKRADHFGKGLFFLR